MVDKADALALVLERAGCEGEVLPSSILAIVLAIGFIRIGRAVHVGVVDQNRLTSQTS